MAPPRCLAVDRQDRLLHVGGRRRGGPQRQQPVRKTGLKGPWLQEHQDASEDVLAWDPAGQVQRLQKEVLFAHRPHGDGGGSAGPGQDGQQRDDNHTDQRMLQVDGGARVLQLLEMPNDLVQTDPLNVRHDRPSVRRRRRSHTEEGTKKSPRAQTLQFARSTYSSRWPWRDEESRRSLAPGIRGVGRGPASMASDRRGVLFHSSELITC